MPPGTDRWRSASYRNPPGRRPVVDSVSDAETWSEPHCLGSAPKAESEALDDRPVVVGGAILGEKHSALLVRTRTSAGVAYAGAVEVFGATQLAGILSALRARASSPFTGWTPKALWLEPEIEVNVRYLAQGPVAVSTAREARAPSEIRRPLPPTRPPNHFGL